MRGILLVVIVLVFSTQALAFEMDDRIVYTDYAIEGEGFDIVHEVSYIWFQDGWHPWMCSGTALQDGWLESCSYDFLLPAGSYFATVYACDLIDNAYQCDWKLEDFSIVRRPEPAAPDSQFGVWKNVGGSRLNDSLRNIRDVRGPHDVEFWDRFLALYITPYTDQGVRRVHLHNPFGTINNSIELMGFDQYLDAREQLPGLANTFVDAIKPLTGQGIEVIAYVGTPKNDRDMDDMSEVEKWKYAQRSLKPLFDAKTSIGLDAAALAGEDTFTYRLAEALRDKGVRVYTESRALKAHPHWFEYNQIMLNSQWIRTDPDLDMHPAVDERFPTNDQLTGEIVRLFRGSEYDTEDPTEVSKIEAVVNDGHTIMFNFHMWDDVEPYFLAELEQD